MSQTAAHLLDHVIPPVPVRLWDSSLPIGLRLLPAAHPEPITPVLRVVQYVLGRHLLEQAGLGADQGHGGAAGPGLACRLRKIRLGLVRPSSRATHANESRQHL